MASTSSATTSSSIDANLSQNFVVQPALSQPLQQGLMPTPYHCVPLFSQSGVWFHDTTSVLTLNLNVDGLLKEWEEKQSMESDETSKNDGLHGTNMSTSSTESLPSLAADNDRPSVASAAKTLRFILEKQLTKSDVSTSSRIILPKKLAEAKLPTLNNKCGIALTVRDVLSSDKWKMKYRYWPNNNSKMFVLESAGAFIRKHKLKLGDYIAIYQDDNNETYIYARKMDRPPYPLELAAHTEDGRMGCSQTTTWKRASSSCNINVSTSSSGGSSVDGVGVEDEMIDFRRQPTFGDLDLSFFNSNRLRDD